MKKTAKPVVALIYDFDGTLSPGNMQEYGFIPATGLSKDEFWSKSRQLTESQDASSILCYMKLMVDEALQNGLPLTRESLRQYGSNVQLFNGVTEWFDAINSYGQSRGVTIQHYINSSGLKEIIEGTPIAEHFSHIYACSFLYSEQGQAVWPAVAVDFTAKTQFLFMINKGIKDVKDNHMVNRYIPPTMRPIPFSRMIYFGDGETDIPCMRLVKEQGGTSIAVYDPHKKETEERRRAAERLIKDNRVNFVCPADYTTSNVISSPTDTFGNHPNSLETDTNLLETNTNLLEANTNSLETDPKSLEDNLNSLEDQTTLKLFDVVRITIDKIKADFDYHSILSSK